MDNSTLHLESQEPITSIDGEIFDLQSNPATGNAPDASPRLTAALEYASQGLRIFPCRPSTKFPCFKQPFENATTNPDVIQGWFEIYGDCNIAYCPEDNGYCVADIDTKDGKPGLENWLALDFPKPVTATVGTPTGGIHYHYKGSLRPTAGRIAPNVDTRGIRSLALLPPSVSADGGEYNWLIPLEAAAPVPDGLAELAKPRERARLEAPEGVELDQPWNLQVARDHLARVYEKDGPWGEDDPPDTYTIAADIKDLAISEGTAVDLMMEHLAEDEREWLSITVHNAYHYGQNAIGAKAYPDPKALLAAIPPGTPTGPASGANMGEPVDVFGGLLTPQPILRRDMLPPAIADYAFDRAACLGVEPEMVAIPALVACASAVHDGITLQPKARDTEWTESARLWAAMLAPPGGKKTPALKAALWPLKNLEQDRRREDDRKLAEYRAALEQYKQLTKSNPANPPSEPEKPVMRRLLVGDATMEKLAEILAENDRGLLMEFDELAGFIGGFDAYRSNGAHKDRTAALELHNGGYKSVDRVKGSIAVPNWGASIVGGIQPDKLREMAARSKMADDGLLQRFLMFEGRTIGIGEDREPDYMATNRYAAVVRRLVNLAPSVPARSIRLSADARRYWLELEQLADALQSLPTTPAALRGHLAKLPGTFARLLLTMHAIECASAGDIKQLDPEVSEATAGKCYDLLVRFFLPHAIRTYGELFRSADSEGERMRRVARAVLLHDDDRITDRDIYRACRELTGPEHAMERQRIMQALAGYCWVEPMDPIDNTSWRINPVLRERFAAEREAERKRRDEECRKIDEAKGIWRRVYGERQAA